jgi:hypothetical protein
MVEQILRSVKQVRQHVTATSCNQMVAQLSRLPLLWLLVQVEGLQGPLQPEIWVGDGGVSVA